MEDIGLRVHITNLYGLYGTAGQVQNMVADIAKKYLQYNELDIYCYRGGDSPEMLRARIDGILASVGHEDVVILQHPVWNGIDFEETLLRHLSAYRGLKKIFFIHDVEPLMFNADDRMFNRYINFYNQSDLIILPSQNMADFLCSKGLSVNKIIIQRMWDSPILIDSAIIPRFNKVIQFAGDINTQKFSFARDWAYDTVKLIVTEKESAWAEGKNIDCIGWFSNENFMADVFRRNGGFGLLWTEDVVCKEYMKHNACCKLSTYLAAGLPVIVSNSIPEANTILEKKLGLAVDSLDEAVRKIECMTEGQYNQMVTRVASFGKLLREGYFTKKLLIDAVFQVLYD